MRQGIAKALLIGFGIVGLFYLSSRQPPVAPSTDNPSNPAAFVPTVQNEALWIPEIPPKMWPRVSVMPGTKPPPERPASARIADAKRVIERWDAFVADRRKSRPTTRQIGPTLDDLLEIMPSAPEFSAAWAAFVRLRKIDREAAEIERAQKR